MPFFDRNDGVTGTNYRLNSGWKEIVSLGSVQTTTNLNQTGSQNIKGFVIHTSHEILSGADQGFGLRLFENGSAITSYGSAVRSDGAVVSGKATDHIQGATNNPGNSFGDVVSGTIKVWVPQLPFSGTGGWAVAEVMSLNDVGVFDRYYYKFQLSDTNGFDYQIYWDWVGSSTTSMSSGSKYAWFTGFSDDYPGMGF